ncbi:hypothetical protein Sps_03441 [Shewanella psychrophila]|uniref:NlpC/P60 family protein n=1 Tax=Shewanella psychrophila TaxID=225848 RepID=A0A1S6HSY8_9GAMM|nr:hypothetical protein [Shewanella psychrophila]AQS38568.1 hypothetical protein Sps_03441 [Shewanella psychrophila]
MAVAYSSLLRYRTVPYVDGGRDMNGWDCYGLARYVAQTHYHYSELSMFDTILAANKRQLTKAYRAETTTLRRTNTAADGCLVACLQQGVCVHLGIVVEVSENNQLVVLHTGEKTGGLMTPLPLFLHQQQQLEFWQ